MKKILCGLMAFALTSMSAMEFGSAGYNTGTGVANKENVYSQYYNPALTALTSKRISSGLNLEVLVKPEGFYEMLEGKSFFNPNLDAILNGNIAVGSNTSVGAFFAGLNLRFEGHMKFKTKTNNQGFKDFDGSAKTLLLLEVPVSYAYAFDFNQFGKLSVGVTGKYLLGATRYLDVQLGEDSNIMEALGLLKGVGDIKHNFTLDLGVAYNIGILTVGIVGKNLTAPTFDYGKIKVALDPQARAGAALDWGILHASVDVDLTQNKNIFDKNIKEQMIAASVGLGGEWIRGDFGIEADIANNKNLYYLFGLRLGIFDLSAKISDQMTRVNGVKVPNDWKFGGGLSFRI